jgi:phenylacetate-coenzyme A ligase PaaK-like adenylate-forming protein
MPLPGTLAILLVRRPTRARLDAFRDRRVRALVAHAYRRVPYYRRLLDAHGVRPEDVRGVGDLPKVPVTTRATLQRLVPEDVVARDLDPLRLLERWSGGTTGQRLVVRRSRSEQRVQAALRNRVGRWMGRRMRERGMRIERPPGSPGRGEARGTAVAPWLGLYRDRAIDCFAPPERILAELRAYRPDVVGGFPGVLTRVAQAAGPGGLADLGVRAVVTGGEVLGPSMRRQIGGAFAAPVQQTYGCIEVNLIAWDCAASGEMHVCEDGVVLEVLRDGQPAAEGEVGEAVLTGLHGWAMPFIRYQVGDLVTQGRARCACGASWPTIRGVQGRMLDYFFLPDGRVIHPYELSLPMWDAHPWVARYRLTQERVDRVVLELVPLGPPPAGALAALRRRCEDTLGTGVTLEVEVVGDLPLEPSGKFRLARSLVRSPYDEE